MICNINSNPDHDNYLLLSVLNHYLIEDKKQESREQLQFALLFKQHKLQKAPL